MYVTLNERDPFFNIFCEKLCLNEIDFSNEISKIIKNLNCGNKTHEENGFSKVVSEFSHLFKKKSYSTKL